MSTANFYTQKHFDLWACDDEQFTSYLCPHCNYTDEGDKTDWDTWMEHDPETGTHVCPICGYRTKTPEADGLEGGFDQFSYLDWGDELERDMNAFNDGLTFYRLELEPGYYVGVQILVKSVHENTWAYLEDYMPENLDNEECRYYFDMNRSTAIRRHASEVRKINRWMSANCPGYGLRHLVLGGIFSNGEAIYYPADAIKAATV